MRYFFFRFSYFFFARVFDVTLLPPQCNKRILTNTDSEHPLISEFRVSEETKSILAKRNIDRLFPIQAATFDLIYDGSDVVGRAKTGTGSFVFVFVCSLIRRQNFVVCASNCREIEGREVPWRCWR
jgi:hypothetical protein